MRSMSDGLMQMWAIEAGAQLRNTNTACQSTI
jgi:hypothetical protein